MNTVHLALRVALTIGKLILFPVNPAQENLCEISGGEHVPSVRRGVDYIPYLMEVDKIVV